MSRRIKPDRRTVADRGTVFEIIRIVEYPGIPKLLVAELIDTRDWLWRVSSRLEGEKYRHDSNREGMALDCGFKADSIDCLLKDMRLIPDDDPLEFW